MSYARLTGTEPARPTRIAAAGSVTVAVATTLALGSAIGSPVAPVAGLAAGVALAAATASVAGPRRAPVRGGVLAALGGLLGGAGVLLVTLREVPWPPTPPVPYLPAAPFLMLLAGGLVGFGGAAAAWRVPPARAGRAGRRAAAVAVFPLSIALVASDGVGAAIVLVAVVATHAVLRRPTPDAAALVTGIALAAPLVLIDERLAAVAVDAAATEARRRFLVETLAETGTFAPTVGVVVAGLAVATGFLVAIRLAARVGAGSERAGLGLASAGAFLAAVAAGVAGLDGLGVAGGVGAALLAWDLGDFAATLGREVGRDGTTLPGELVHAVGAAALAGVAVLAGAAVAALGGAVSAGATPAAVVAAAAAAVGTLLLLVAVR